MTIARVLFVATVAFAAVAQTPQKRSGAVTIDKLQIEIPDLLVVDQDGVKRRFYSDLIKDKVVILSFFYTSCPNMCPVMSNTLGKLQTNLGDRLGKDVFIITVTRDPETDTPSRMKAWGKNVHVKSGWTMVTGDVKAIGKLVRDFTGDRLGQDMHNTIFIVGNDKTGAWSDLSGYASVTDLREQIDALIAASPPDVRQGSALPAHSDQ
jgi:protein SCO1/2